MKYPVWKIPYLRAQTPIPLLSAGYSPLLAAVLASRDILDPKSAEEFLHPGADMLQSPFELLDMHTAVSRINEAAESSERVAVYGDYDVDGITATCLLGDYLRSIGIVCELYIPGRIDEGYGLNTAAIDTLISKGVTLIVTVDCGITAIKETAYAKSRGVDLIITDHHECINTLPDAVAVVDPKRPDSGGYKQLAGVGVALKLVSALMGDSKKALARYCDLAALGTVADVMPVVGENRQIIIAGLKKLIKSPRPGIKALIRETGADTKKLTAASLSFTLAPRINAAGRLGTPFQALSLLMSEDEDESAALAAELCELNRSRQKLETGIFEQAALAISEMPRGPIILTSDTWHQGVVGIVASRLTEAYSLPAILICMEGDTGKGSCRSYGGFDMFAALCYCSHLLEDFGGHPLAAGLTIKRENLSEFIRIFSLYYAQNPIKNENFLAIDLIADSAQILSMSCVESLDALEPCGSGNPRALLCLMDAKIESIVPIGGGKHLKLRISKYGQIFDCVYFSHTVEDLGLLSGDKTDIAFFPQINEYKNRKTVQLLIEDMRPGNAVELCTAVLLGEDIPSRFLKKPDRSDFSRTWRSISSYGGKITAPVSEALRIAGGGIGPVKTALCLTVFEELGLIAFEMSEKNITITAGQPVKKVELSDSPKYKKLFMNK